MKEKNARVKIVIEDIERGILIEVNKRIIEARIKSKRS
jgi:hypothetical protein